MRRLVKFVEELLSSGNLTNWERDEAREVLAIWRDFRATSRSGYCVNPLVVDIAREHGVVLFWSKERHIGEDNAKAVLLGQVVFAGCLANVRHNLETRGIKINKEHEAPYIWPEGRVAREEAQEVLDA